MWKRKKKQVFVLTVPEGLDIWNPNDENAAAQLKAAEQVIINAKEGNGSVLPFGWKLERF